MTLVSSSHLGLFPQDKEAGAIKLELMPARPFSSSELQTDRAAGQQSTDEGGERQPRAQRRVEANGATKTEAESATSPKLLYVDRVVQEILETERTYVQDLKSIVEVRCTVGGCLKFVLQDQYPLEIKGKEGLAAKGFLGSPLSPERQRWCKCLNRSSLKRKP